MNTSLKIISDSKGLKERLAFRVSIASLFKSTPEVFNKDYGGDLIAYSFEQMSAEYWFEKFRHRLLDSIGKEYLPVSRMADGEYHFLMGMKFNYSNLLNFRYTLSFIFHRCLEVFYGPRIITSWGEIYGGREVLKLRNNYKKNLNDLLKNGILCAFLFENPLNAFVHYNKCFFKYFDTNQLVLNKDNYFPFHFPLFTLSNDGWQEFIAGRKILIVTGNLDKRKQILERNLINLGARKIGFYEISSDSSMKDKVDIAKIKVMQEFELALVGAGIGSLNIISQMQWFTGPVIDVGGFISVLYNKDFQYHGGAARFPGII